VSEQQWQELKYDYTCKWHSKSTQQHWPTLYAGHQTPSQFIEWFFEISIWTDHVLRMCRYFVFSVGFYKQVHNLQVSTKLSNSLTLRYIAMSNHPLMTKSRPVSPVKLTLVLSKCCRKYLHLDGFIRHWTDTHKSSIQEHWEAHWAWSYTLMSHNLSHVNLRQNSSYCITVACIYLKLASEHTWGSSLTTAHLTHNLGLTFTYTHLTRHIQEPTLTWHCTLTQFTNYAVKG